MIETFRKYGGAGLILIWFLIALVYLFFKEKKKNHRILFLYMPTVILLFFFNPLFFSVFNGLTEEAIYFRFLWLLPITVVIAYAAVYITNTLRGRKKIYFGLAAVCLVLISGKPVYTSPLFERAENIYHVPQEVVEICDAIEIEGREVMAAFPEEFLLYVRQYSPFVCMPYGREVIMGEYNEFHQLMKQEEISVDEMAVLAKQYRCHYVIVSEEKNLIGDIAEYDYEIYEQIGEYVIYKDTTMNFSVN